MIREYEAPPAQPARRARARVAHLTSVHPATDVRILRECIELRNAGYDVTIVGQHAGDTVVHGVRIRALRAPANRLERLRVTIPAVFREARRLNADVYHFHDPELLFVGMALELLGARVVYDVHEDVPRQVLTKEWLPAVTRVPLSRAVDAVHQGTASMFSGIVCAWPNIAAHLRHRNMTVVQNYPNEDEFAVAASDFVPMRDRANTVLYCGGLNAARGVREMVQAVHDSSLPQDVRLQLGGLFDDPALQAEATDALRYPRVQYAGYMDRTSYRRALASARIGISLCHPTPAYVETLSTKVFEYLSAGLPVILSDFPRWRAIVDEYDCGIAVNPLDTRAIARAMHDLLSDPDRAQAMGQRGRRAIEERYNWSTEAKRLRGLYDTLEGSVRR